MTWSKQEFKISALILRGVMVLICMACEQKYGWPEGTKTEESRSDLIHKMRETVGL